MSASTFLYVGNAETRDVSAFKLSEEEGGLAPIVYQWRFDAETGHLTPNEPPFVSVQKH